MVAAVVVAVAARVALLEVAPVEAQMGILVATMVDAVVGAEAAVGSEAGRKGEVGRAKVGAVSTSRLC